MGMPGAESVHAHDDDGGNPLACAAALAAITVLLEEDLAGQAKIKGQYLVKQLNTLRNDILEFWPTCAGWGC